MFNLSLTLFCRFGERKLRTKNLCMNSNSTIIKKNSKYPLRLLFSSIIFRKLDDKSESIVEDEGEKPASAAKPSAMNAISGKKRDKSEDDDSSLMSSSEDDEPKKNKRQKTK